MGNSIRSGLVGLVLGGAISIGMMAAAAPITGPVDPASIISQINQYILSWMSFPTAENGELQLLGPFSFETATAGTKVMVVVDQTGTVRYITTSTTPPN
jgi:hypothetical protein